MHLISVQSWTYLSSRDDNIRDKTRRIASRRSCKSWSKDQCKKSKVVRVIARNDQRIEISDEQVNEMTECNNVPRCTFRQGGGVRRSYSRDSAFQSADVCQQETPPDTWYLLAKCYHKRRAVGKNWTGRCSNHDKTKEVEMDWPYLEERGREHH